MAKPEIGMILHYVMPDMTCRAALVTKAAGISVNLAVFPEGPAEHQAPFRHPHVHQLNWPMLLVEGVGPAKKVPEYVPAAKALEHEHMEKEKARHEAEMAAAHTEEEKKAVKPPAKFTPPSPEVLAQAEEKQEQAHAEVVAATVAGTYHVMGEHAAMVEHHHDVEIRKHHRELEKAKAKHAAEVEAVKKSPA